MRKIHSEARKKALKYLGITNIPNLPYQIIALEVAAKDQKVILSTEIDLTDKLQAASFLAAWSGSTRLGR